ncbi:MAG: murein biosynthesis integral membrane protein MurJ [Acidobacteria bacterium]|nr:MAG: murein biosynthesis integral membrane protein MurJ [Acidobacteriota bacterium]
MTEKHHGLVRAAGSMSVMTMLSRIAGYFRDNLQADILGAANSSDAFIIAYRIPNMLRRLLAEGALTSAFVPTFARYVKGEDRRAAWRLAASVLYVLTAILAAIVALGVLFSPWVVRMLAWGFGELPEKFDLTVSLNRLMFPYIFFISLAALATGILNSFDVFALTAFTPVLLNLAIIGSALALRHRFPDPAYGFAIGVIVGGFLQLAVQVPSLVRLGMDFRLPRPLDRQGLREIGRLFLPRLFGVGITQVNLVIDSQFATSLRSGSVSFLYYAIRVTELTLGVFAISLSTVILPTLSRATAERDRALVVDTLQTAMRLLVFVTVPATVGLIVLRWPIIHVLFERGRFTAEDTTFTAGALAFYAIGLLPYAAVNVQAAAFYAHRDTRTPVKVGILTFFLHLGLNFALRGPMGHNGIALSTSLSALADSALLAWLLRRRAGEYLDRGVLISTGRTLAASTVMAAGLLMAGSVVPIQALHGTVAKAGVLGALIAGGGGIFLLVSYLLGGEEVRLLRAFFVRTRA